MSIQKKKNHLNFRKFSSIITKLAAVVLGTFLLLTTYLGTYTFGEYKEFEFETYWGEFGSEKGQLHHPKGLVVDRFDNIYVVDSHNQRIQKFTKEGEFITAWGLYGTRSGEFRSPYGIAIDSRGNVFVTDQINNNVQRFDSDGKYITKWGTKPIPRTRSSGDRPSQLSPETYLAQPGFFDGPTGIAIDSGRNVYVVDSGNERIQKFNKRGEFLMAWDILGITEESDPGDILDTSQGIAVDKEDNVYVVDKANKRIQKFDSEGKFLAFLPKATLSSPEGITIDNLGFLYVTDRLSGLIQKYDQEGNLLEEIKSHRKGNEKTVNIVGIAIANSGDIYISDTRNHNIQKFEKSSRLPNLQLFINEVDLALTYFLEEQSARMRLMPDSVHGVIITSGNSINAVGKIAVIGETPAGDPAKVVAFTLQNKDFRLEHKIRVQLGYLDTARNFVIGHDSTVFLNKYKSAGDSILVPVEPFFVPANQISNMKKDSLRDFAERFGDIPANLLDSDGTFIVARIASDGQSVPTEMSLSVILNP